MAVYTDKFTFYHVPKTGGTFIRDNLELIVVNGVSKKPKQSSKDNFLTSEHNTPEEFIPVGFSFCFFRNPLDWYKSLWKFKNTGIPWTKTNESGAYLYSRNIASNDFNEFVRKLFQLHPEGLCSHVYRQFERVDFIGKYENLLEDFKKAMEMSGEDVDWEKLDLRERNQSAKNLKPEYDEDTLKLVMEADKYFLKKYYDEGD